MKLFYLIDGKQVHLDTQSKVIPEKEWAVALDSKELQEQVLFQAEKFRKEVVQECEVLKTQAEESGFAEGLEQFFKHIQEVDQAVKKLTEDMQKKITPLVLEAAKKVVGQELTQTPSTITNIVMNTLKSVVNDRRITIFVHRDDKAQLEEERVRIKSALENVEMLVIEEKEDIARGGCVIETETGIINARIEVVWEKIGTVFQNLLQELRE